MAYENGLLNLHQSRFAHRQPVLRDDKDPDTLWVKPSVESGEVGKPVLVVKPEFGRIPSSEAHYLMEGANSFVGWPSAYGGVDTPVDQDQIYVSWYMRPKYDPRWYWSAIPFDLVGDFIPDEKVVYGDGEGRFIGLSEAGETRGMLQFELPGHRNANNLLGQRITGIESGASVTFNPELSNIVGPGPNKYLRIWEDPAGNEGLRLSWTAIQLAHRGMASSDTWYSANVNPREWNFMEIFLDGRKGQVSAWVNGKLEFFESFGEDKNLEGKFSPSIALLGFNGGNQVFQAVEVDDIYMDYRLSRVIIGSSSVFSELNSYDLQIPLSWSQGRISAIFNEGPFSGGKQFFVYVVNEFGEANEKGFPLCIDCISPPKAPSTFTVD
jgi:hypothetical protein